MYRYVVRSLIYIATGTRLELLVATAMLAFFLQEPKSWHMTAMKRALRYFYCKKQIMLVLKLANRSQPIAFVDGSWGNSCERERRSHSGMLVKFGDAVVTAAMS